MNAQLTFHGGAGTVTGANFLLDAGDPPDGGKILIDCGIHEREQICDPANYGAFPYDTKSIDALFITHAHADHIGRVPKLVRDGFKSIIYSTPATKELSAIMFEDALSVMKISADAQNCGVLYEEADVARALFLWKTHEYHKPFAIGDIQVEFLDAGHILGSAMIKFTRDKKTIIFTGDLGNSPEPLLNDTESPEGANYLVMESVYGDRVHEDRAERQERLRQAIEQTRERKGVLLIPSFSLERTQILLFEIDKLAEDGSIGRIPVYLDSPLAIRITEIFRRYQKIMNPEARKHFTKGHNPFSSPSPNTPRLAAGMKARRILRSLGEAGLKASENSADTSRPCREELHFPGLVLTEDARDSKAIHKSSNPKIIIAGAGMSHGGRIQSHEKRYLGDKNTTLLFAGYQAPGSLGRRIQDGEKRVEIEGEHITVRARIETVSGYSGHKDREGLLDFASNGGETLEKVFVTMGEPKSSFFLAQRLKDFLNVEAIVPEAGQSFEIEW